IPARTSSKGRTLRNRRVNPELTARSSMNFLSKQARNCAKALLVFVLPTESPGVCGVLATESLAPGLGGPNASCCFSSQRAQAHSGAKDVDRSSGKSLLRSYACGIPWLKAIDTTLRVRYDTMLMQH